jgi:hypothetical protein
MNLIPGLTWLTSMASRRASATAADTPDPAGMGTAFGLDACTELEMPKASSKSKPAPMPPSNRLVRRPRR